VVVIQAGRKVKTKERGEDMDRSKMLFCPDLETLTKERMATFLADQLFGDADRLMEEMAKTLESYPECSFVV
jgi:hypothetical protein